MMLRTSFGLQREAASIENAVAAAFQGGARTRDIYTGEGKLLGTAAFGDEITSRLQ